MSFVVSVVVLIKRAVSADMTVGHCFDDNIDNLKQLAVVFALQADAESNLFGLCRAQPKISKKRHYTTGQALYTSPQAYCLPGRTISIAHTEDFVPGYRRFAPYCLPGRAVKFAQQVFKCKNTYFVQ